MGKIYNQMLLRQSYEYRDFVHTAILNVADLIRGEPESTPYHAARDAMAERLITTEDGTTSAFVNRIVFRGLMEDGIREELVKNGKIILDNANEDLILAGIDVLWNETTLAVWPTIMDDITEGE